MYKRQPYSSFCFIVASGGKKVAKHEDNPKTITNTSTFNSILFLDYLRVLLISNTQNFLLMILSAGIALTPEFSPEWFSLSLYAEYLLYDALTLL